MGVSTFIWSIYFAGVHDYSLFYKLELIEGISTLLLLPSLNFGFRALTHEQSLGWKDYIWLLPAVIIGGGMCILYLLMGDTQATAYIREIAETQGTGNFTAPVFQIHQLLSVYIYAFVVFGQVLLVLIVATVYLVRYRHRLDQFFSNLEGKSLENQRALLVGLYLVLVLALVTYRGRFQYHEVNWSIQLIMLLWGILIYYMGHHIYRLRYTADNLVSDLKEADQEAVKQGVFPDEEKVSGMDTDQNENRKKHQKLLDSFTQEMDEHSVYLRKDLRLTELALLMHTNRTYLSNFISAEFGCSFSDYVNGRRIEHAQNLIRADYTLTEEQVTEQSGFTHTSSFSRVFKQQTGVTFREWRKKNGEQA